MKLQEKDIDCQTIVFTSTNRNKLTKSTRYVDDRSIKMTLVHKPTNLSVEGSLKSANYSKNQFIDEKKKLYNNLYNQLEEKVIIHTKNANHVINSIKSRISNELKVREINGVHGITKENIHSYLIEPKLERYIGSVNDSDLFDLWTVFLENSKSKSGYTIFFDEESNCFGLGTYSSDGKLVHVSENGSFLDTLKGM